MNTKLAKMVVEMVEAAKRANSFQSLTVRQVYDSLNARQALTVAEFHRLMTAMHKAYIVTLGPWTLAMALLPCKETSLVLDGETKFYVRMRNGM